MFILRVLRLLWLNPTVWFLDRPFHAACIPDSLWQVGSLTFFDGVLTTCYLVTTARPSFSVKATAARPLILQFHGGVPDSTLG